MSQRLRPDPAEFERCVRCLCTRIGTIATRSGMADLHGADLEGTLAAMPPTVRDRTRLTLKGIAISTACDEPVMAFAARYLLSFARDIWDTIPHPVTHTAAAPLARIRWN
jgi:hypothetical protein